MFTWSFQLQPPTADFLNLALGWSGAKCSCLDESTTVPFCYFLLSVHPTHKMANFPPGYPSHSTHKSLKWLSGPGLAQEWERSQQPTLRSHVLPGMFLVAYPCECNRIPADGGRRWTLKISLCPLSLLQAAWFAHGKHWFPACLSLSSHTGYMWKSKIQLQNAQLCLRWSIAKYQIRNSKNRLPFLLQKFFFFFQKRS